VVKGKIGLRMRTGMGNEMKNGEWKRKQDEE
jgi:hypothetical protein